MRGCSSYSLDFSRKTNDERRRLVATWSPPIRSSGSAYPSLPNCSVVQNAYRPPTAFSMMPPVVKNLLIVNGLAFLAQMSFDGFMGEWFALWPITGGKFPATLFYPWQVITSGFLHGGFGHLFINMFMLWMFGMRIENVLGSRRFVFFYFICLAGASVLQLLIVSAPFMFDVGTPGIFPTLGASGAILGVLAAFGLLFPNEPIYLYFFVPIPAKWLVLGMAAFNLYAGVAGTQSGIANFAHLGGMLTGFLLIQYWRGRLPVKPRPSQAV